MLLRYNFNPIYIVANVIFYDSHRKRVHVTKDCWNELYSKLILCFPLSDRRAKTFVLKNIIANTYKRYVLQNKTDEAIHYFNEHMLTEFGELEDSDIQHERFSPSEMNIDVSIEEEASFREEYLGGSSLEKKDFSIELFSRMDNFHKLQYEIEGEINNSLNHFLSVSRINHMTVNCIGYSKIRNSLLNFLNSGELISHNEAEKVFYRKFLTEGFLYRLKELYSMKEGECEKCNNDIDCRYCEKQIHNRCNECKIILSQECISECPYSSERHNILSHPNYEHEIEYEYVQSIPKLQFGSGGNYELKQKRVHKLLPYRKFFDCSECKRLNPYNFEFVCMYCRDNNMCKYCLKNYGCSLHSDRLYLCNCGSLYMNSVDCKNFRCPSNQTAYGPIRTKLGVNFSVALKNSKRNLLSHYVGINYVPLNSINSDN